MKGKSLPKVDHIPSKIFKGCLPQILLSPFLNTLSHISQIYLAQKRVLNSLSRKRRNAGRHPAGLLSKIKKTMHHCFCFPYYLFFNFKTKHWFHNSSFFILSFLQKKSYDENGESKPLFSIIAYSIIAYSTPQKKI